MKIQLKIEHKGKMYFPVVEGAVEWATERFGSPGILTCSLLFDDALKFSEGDTIHFKVDGHKLFYGFIFTEKSDKSNLVKITAYDQLRYLKNKESMKYKNKTLPELIKMIAADFRLQTGDLADTKFKIASRTEDNETLFDIIGNAMDLTLLNTSTIYVMYDDYGKIALKNVADMRIDLLISDTSAENYDYSSSIDSDTYNKIKLIFDNEESKKREVYIAQDGKKMNEWGVLQFYDTLQKGENGKSKVDALLKLYDRKTKGLKLKNVLGDLRVRAGSLLAVNLKLRNEELKNLMLVEKCKHTFQAGEHWMDLTLRGGDFTDG